MNDDLALNALSAIANETRLKILKRLVKAAPNAMSAGELAEHVKATPSKVSFHLSALEDVGFISSSREHRKINYTVNFQSLGALLNYLLVDCCADNEVVRNCCIQSKNCC